MDLVVRFFDVMEDKLLIEDSKQSLFIKKSVSPDVFNDDMILTTPLYFRYLYSNRESCSTSFDL